MPEIPGISRPLKAFKIPKLNSNVALSQMTEADHTHSPGPLPMMLKGDQLLARRSMSDFGDGEKKCVDHF